MTLQSDRTATVLAFDPGGKTGWAAITVPAVALIGAEAGYHGDPPLTTTDSGGSFLKAGPLNQEIVDFALGEIDCGVGGRGAENAVGRGHGQLNIAGETCGVGEMINLAWFRYRESAVVLEEFTLEQNQKHADLLYPVRVMAGFWNSLESMHEEMDGDTFRGVQRIFINRRVDAKTVVTDARLRQWGLYRRDSGPHARDATRHAYHFLRRCRGGSSTARELRWRAWPHLFEDPQITRKPKRQKKIGERINF